MRLIPIDKVQPGMVLGKTLYREEDGKILLVKGTVLKYKYIERMKSFGFPYLYIRDPFSLEDEEIIQPIRDETKIKAVQVLKSAIQQVERNEEVNIKRIREVVVEVVDQILEDQRIAYSLLEMNSHDAYTYNHSVNVTILALLIGSYIGLSRDDLELLGVGAMMHDIGKTLIDPHILNKPARLDYQEFEIMKQHSRKGFEILKDKLPSFIPAHIALQHHEREDGSGYPRGITGSGIHRFSKIVAVADVFDAMTSNRIYQVARPPFEAIQEIAAECDQKFDRRVVRALSKVIAPFPIGSVLLFQNGLQGVVTFVSRIKCLVELMDGPSKGQRVDLYQMEDLQVAKVLGPV
ncbi:metal dependent phosphohydrolase [Hydrogenispora ethanolica]|jgi:putative nucleotidyltransferase with HDIG domain|uniref:Metal dependent phosphohydrolase n=1 Tax=Hydrogenispora ethanolica TaxID=1082276 RepID=A0A4R1RIL5_HYDET|nr:HD-GYP domain-containing protein [Hydrogenispora ethanolica]TCL65948.1 metal dependent phosphohydrolase [Hydrogenispora ethanolica]